MNNQRTSCLGEIYIAHNTLLEPSLGMQTTPFSQVKFETCKFQQHEVFVWKSSLLSNFPHKRALSSKHGRARPQHTHNTPLDLDE